MTGFFQKDISMMEIPTCTRATKSTTILPGLDNICTASLLAPWLHLGTLHGSSQLHESVSKFIRIRPREHKMRAIVNKVPNRRLVERNRRYCRDRYKGHRETHRGPKAVMVFQLRSRLPTPNPNKVALSWYHIHQGWCERHRSEAERR